MITLFLFLYQLTKSLLYSVLQSIIKRFLISEYSGAAEPLFRKNGNRLSGIGNRRVA